MLAEMCFSKNNDAHHFLDTYGFLQMVFKIVV